jgi:exodeoxyribonuclease VII small subunit
MEAIETDPTVGNMTKDSKNKTPKPGEFESDLGELEKIITGMEAETTPLSESLQLFEQGIALSRQAQNSLARAEQKILTLTEGNEGPTEERFSAPDND